MIASDRVPMTYTPPAALPAIPLRAFSPFTLWDGRRAGFCWNAKPRCVLGHRIPDEKAPVTEGLYTCQHREGRDAPACGVRCYLMHVAFAPDERAYLVVEITRSHILKMKARPTLALERISILGCVLPGVDVDLAAGTPGTTSEED